jgi:hypothetical protein
MVGDVLRPGGIYSDVVLVFLALAGLQSFLTRATSEE